MERDGTSETDMEEWLLEMGLGHCYAVTSDADLTKAQAEALAESTPEPRHNAKHQRLIDLLVYQPDA